jgi:hypothetical protein
MRHLQTLSANRTAESGFVAAVTPVNCHDSFPARGGLMQGQRIWSKASRGPPLDSGPHLMDVSKFFTQLQNFTYENP